MPESGIRPRTASARKRRRASNLIDTDGEEMFVERHAKNIANDEQCINFCLAKASITHLIWDSYELTKDANEHRGTCWCWMRGGTVLASCSALLHATPHCSDSPRGRRDTKSSSSTTSSSSSSTTTTTTTTTKRTTWTRTTETSSSGKKVYVCEPSEPIDQCPDEKCRCECGPPPCDDSGSGSGSNSGSKSGSKSKSKSGSKSKSKSGSKSKSKSGSKSKSKSGSKGKSG